MNKSRTIVLYVLSFFLVVFSVCIDQITKSMAVQFLKGQDDYILIENVLQFSYLENTGAAFSLLTGKQSFFLVFTPIVILFVLYLFVRIPKTRRYFPLSVCLLFIVAGAIGNFIDRVQNGFVVDFIYFSYIHFPIFNVADIYVTVSVFALIFLLLFKYKENDFEAFTLK